MVRLSTVYIEYYTCHSLTVGQINNRQVSVFFTPNAHPLKYSFYCVIGGPDGTGVKTVRCFITDFIVNVVKASGVNSWVRLQCFAHRLHLANINV